MPVLRVSLSHRSALPPDALRAALASRVRREAWRPLFRRVDLLAGELDGRHVWLRPVGTRWENPQCQLTGVIEPREGGSALHGELAPASRVDRVMMAALPAIILTLAAATAVRDSLAAGLAILGVGALMRAVLHVFCLRARAEILRVVRLAEATEAANSTRTRSLCTPLSRPLPPLARGERRK